MSHFKLGNSTQLVSVSQFLGFGVLSINIKNRAKSPETISCSQIYPGLTPNRSHTAKFQFGTSKQTTRTGDAYIIWGGRRCSVIGGRKNSRNANRRKDQCLNGSSNNKSPAAAPQQQTVHGTRKESLEGNLWARDKNDHNAKNLKHPQSAHKHQITITSECVYFL
jgi:hypothetical protein